MDRLDDKYIKWLYRNVSPGGLTPPGTYWKLMVALYTKEFVWVIPNDDNRLGDGLELRLEFLEEAGIHKITVRKDWLRCGCSMLELFIALSRRLEFMTQSSAREHFWEMMRRLSFIEYNDSHDFDLVDVDSTLDRIIWRTYEPSGAGGLFPLEHATQDQTKVELWYQLSAFVLENQ